MTHRVMPSYRELPELAGLGIRHTRDLLPADAGTLSLISAADVAAAAATVELGETIPLNLAVDAFSPPLFGRAVLRHRILQLTRNDSEDLLDDFNPQSSSQIDGLAHVRAREHGYFDGSTESDEARESIGMHHWARRGIAGRGVLLDLAVDDPFDGSTIHADELAACAQRQGASLRSGDIVMVRTGWAAAYLAHPDPRGTAAWRGLSAGDEMAEFLWDTGVAMLGADNPAVEDSPGDSAVGSLHRRLLPGLGLPLMELLDLERLGTRCAELGRWSFLFVAVPLNIRGGVSSTANAMAIL